jgi:YidC/Oxa1 family membrane protein insertase
MDKNSIIGFFLIAGVFILFFFLNKPTEAQLAAQKHYQDSIAQVQKLQTENQKSAVAQSKSQTADSSENFLKTEAAPDSLAQLASSDLTAKGDSVAKEQIVTLENADVKIDISTIGGQMISAQLKNYKRFDEKPLYLFNKDASFGITLKNKTGVNFSTISKSFQPIFSADKKTLTMRHAFSPTQYVDFVYKLLSDNSMIKFDVNIVGMTEVLSRDNSEYIQVDWAEKLFRQEKGIDFEKRYSKIYYKYVGGDVDDLSDSKDAKKEVADPVKWIAFKGQYFTTTLISDFNLSNASLESRVLQSEEFLKYYSASFYSPVAVNGKNLSAGFRFYLGPVEFSKLRKLDAGVKDKDQQLDMDKLVPLGWTLFRWVNQYFVIPLFNLLSSWGLGMGIIILLMTIIVKLVLAPFTFKSYMSSAKMRVLRPQVQALTAKFPKQDQMMERQKATMDLYSRAGVNPMSGCLPMLLQMPVLLALFSFFPSAIELRQHSFLWAHDLSSYDDVFTWSANIPFISSWFGNHVSLFCLLMTAVNVVYMKFSMDQQDTGQQQIPGMKLMMYFMPVMMLFVLNKYPSGLTYYYFISTLFTILLTVGFRYMVNEDKVLAKLEENKKKPKKKSGFMARLEEAQRIQQQQAKTKNGGAKKK